MQHGNRTRRPAPRHAPAGRFLRRRTVLTAALGLGAGAAGGVFGVRPFTASGSTATVSEEVRINARTLDLTVGSPAVGSPVPVRLLLPTGFDTSGTSRTWPVLQLLQGAHDDYTSWSRETDIESFTRDKDVLTVMPSTGPTGIPTRWRADGDGEGADYETFLTAELPQLLSERFRAGRARAVAGVSTGGYGAVALAARNPGVFAAAASYSGILHTLLPGTPTLVRAIVAREGLDPASLWGSPFLQRGLWQENDPYTRAEALRGTPLYISSGSGIAGGEGDPEGEILESALLPSAQSFVHRLKRLGIPATTHLYPGGSHAWSFWEREFCSSWPLIAGGLGLGGV